MFTKSVLCLDFFNGNGAFPVVDCSLSDSVGIVIKPVVEAGWNGGCVRYVLVQNGGYPGRECSAPLGFPGRLLLMPAPLRASSPGPRSVSSGWNMICICPQFRRFASHAGRGGRHDERFQITGYVQTRCVNHQTAMKATSLSASSLATAPLSERFNVEEQWVSHDLAEA